MAKILVVGGSGYIGSRLEERLGAGRCVSTYATHPIPGGVHFDGTTMRLADTVLRGAHGFESAVLLQGITGMDDCARNPAAHATNVDGIIRAIDDLLDAGVKPIFLSSGAVFDGNSGLRTEADEARPILTYGRQKLAVESYLRRQACEWTVFRLTKVLSARPHPSNALQHLLHRLDRGDVIRAATDQIHTPVDMEDVLDAIELATQSGFTGLYHIAGTQALSYHDLTQLLLSFADGVFRRRARVERCSLHDLEFAEPRPKDCSLSSRKFAHDAARTFRSLESVCGQLCAEVLR
jgi:dTDP-4-dehydrorhamnose reductase